MPRTSGCPLSWPRPESARNRSGPTAPHRAARRGGLSSSKRRIRRARSDEGSWLARAAGLNSRERSPIDPDLRVARGRQDTLARQLAADRNAVRLTKDEWLWALGSTPWDERTRECVERELWCLTQEVLRLGLSVGLDFGLWARTERDEMRHVARGLGVGVELHYLATPTDDLWRRIEARNLEPPWDKYPIRRTDFEGWLLVFQAPDPAELALFDSPPESS